MIKTSSFILSVMLAVGIAGCSQESNQSQELRKLSEEIRGIEAGLKEQQAIEAIRTLFSDYGRSLDQRDYNWFASLYSADAVYIAGGEFHGPEAIAKQLETVISANATGANLHIFTNDKIEVDIQQGVANATSRGAFYVESDTGGPMPLMFATYSDRLVLTDTGWKFQRREIRGDIPGPANEPQSQ